MGDDSTDHTSLGSRKDVPVAGEAAADADHLCVYDNLGREETLWSRSSGANEQACPSG